MGYRANGMCTYLNTSRQEVQDKWGSTQELTEYEKKKRKHQYHDLIGPIHWGAFKSCRHYQFIHLCFKLMIHQKEHTGKPFIAKFLFDVFEKFHLVDLSFPMNKNMR